MMYALNGKVVALVVRDVATTFGSVYPSHSAGTEEPVAALQHFVGYAHVKRSYSDSVDVLINAARRLHAPHEASQQGVPQTNGIIE